MACANAQRSLIPMSDIKTTEIEALDVKALDIKALGERVDLLESRLTFQDETIETLNKTITQQWNKIDALTRQLANLSERLQETETHVSGAANEPPPHY
jgi:SlyX protein